MARLPSHEGLSPNVGKIDSIQVLRGVAATLVAAFHLNASAVFEHDYKGVFNLAAHGSVGVDIFFVLSGFIIYYTSVNRPGMTMAEFVSARFWRVLPPYWAILVLYIVVDMLRFLVQGQGLVGPSLYELIVSFALLPSPDQIIPIAWTLVVEIQFYILFALTFFLFGPRGAFIAVLIWAVAAQLQRDFRFIETDAARLVLYSGVSQFLMGMFVAHLHLKGVTRWQWTSLVLGLVLLVGYLEGTLFAVEVAWGRTFMPGIPAAFLLYGALAWKGSVPRPLLLWGEASFLLYLLHLLVYSVMGITMEKALGIQVYSNTWAMVMMLISANVFAVMCTVWIERPYRQAYRAKHKQLNTRRARRNNAGARQEDPA